MLVKFVDQKVLKSKNLAGDVNAVLNYDVNIAANFNVQRDMGTKTNSLLTDIIKDNLVKKKFVDEIVTSFYTASTGYLISNLPLGKQILIDAQYLHSNCRQKNVEKPLLRLVGDVVKCLGGSFNDVFEVGKSCTVDDLKDIIKNEISFYRMETIPETFYLCKQKIKTTHKQPSYWRYAYEVAAGIEEEEEKDKEVFRRIDNYWTDVSQITDETTGKPKYGKLSKLAFCIFVLPHGNSEPERGFSINKHMLQIHGNAVNEETIVALRMVKDHILVCKGVMNVNITQDLIKSVHSAYRRYNEFLNAKKEEEKKAEEEKEKKRLEEAEASSR